LLPGRRNDEEEVGGICKTGEPNGEIYQTLSTVILYVEMELQLAMPVE